MLLRPFRLQEILYKEENMEHDLYYDEGWILRIYRKQPHPMGPRAIIDIDEIEIDADSKREAQTKAVRML